MSTPEEPQPSRLATAALQARAWVAWHAYRAIARSTRLVLTRRGYLPAAIPHLSDEDLLSIPCLNQNTWRRYGNMSCGLSAAKNEAGW